MASSSTHVTLSRDEVLARIIHENEPVEGTRVERSRTWIGKATLAPKNQGKFAAKTERHHELAPS